MIDKIIHTKSPWLYNPLTNVGRITSPNLKVFYANGDIPCIASVRRHKQAKKIKYYEEDVEAEGNGQLISLAPTAPHLCDDEACPGNINLKKLVLLNDIVESLINDCVTCKVEDSSKNCDSCGKNTFVVRAKELQALTK